MVESQRTEHPNMPGHFRELIAPVIPGGDPTSRCTHESHKYVADAYACAFDAMWVTAVAESEAMGDPNFVVQNIVALVRKMRNPNLNKNQFGMTLDAIIELAQNLSDVQRDLIRELVKQEIQAEKRTALCNNPWHQVTPAYGSSLCPECPEV
jgi:hypothetical protein